MDFSRIHYAAHKRLRTRFHQAPPERRFINSYEPRIKPAPPVQITFEDVRGLIIAKIAVAHGEAPLYMMGGIIYLRRGSSDVQAQPEDVVGNCVRVRILNRPLSSRLPGAEERAHLSYQLTRGLSIAFPAAAPRSHARARAPERVLSSSRMRDLLRARAFPCRCCLPRLAGRRVKPSTHRLSEPLADARLDGVTADADVRTVGRGAAPIRLASDKFPMRSLNPGRSRHLEVRSDDNERQARRGYNINVSSVAGQIVLAFGSLLLRSLRSKRHLAFDSRNDSGRSVSAFMSAAPSVPCRGHRSARMPHAASSCARQNSCEGTPLKLVRRHPEYMAGARVLNKRDQPRSVRPRSRLDGEYNAPFGGGAAEIERDPA